MTEPTVPPLAEARWLWRRLYVFLASLGLWTLLADAVARSEPQALPRLAAGLMILLGLTLVLYLVAPSAQQLIVLLAHLQDRLPRGGER
jgi:Na+/serine symporter